VVAAKAVEGMVAVTEEAEATVEVTVAATGAAEVEPSLER